MAADLSLSLGEALLIATRDSSLLAAQRSAIQAAQEGAVSARELPDPKLKLGIDNYHCLRPQYSWQSQPGWF